MFQRIGNAAFKKDLTNTIALCEALGNPQNAFKAIHIAGTNGKGSVSSMIASVLREAGFKTGLYTSPHLRNFTERIRINGEEISEQSVIDFVEENREVIEKIKPSFFEVTVAMAFDHFRNEKVEIAVVEVGMGGRLDSTNILPAPLAGVITNISFDHVQFLGTTLGEIAFEKAGIIKEGMPVVIGESNPETIEVFREVAVKKNATLVLAGEEYKITTIESGLFQRRFELESIKSGQKTLLDCDLTGDYQEKNIATLKCLVDILRDTGLDISTEALEKALKNVKGNSGLKGRMEVLSTHPLVITDTAHNEAGIRYVMNQIRSFKHEKLRMVLGMANDKDVNAVFALLPGDAVFYFVKPDVPRGMDAHELEEKANMIGINGKAYPSVAAGLAAAKADASPDDLIFIGGSTFVVAEVV